eukprot:1583059-Rhodomonas_salina.1
MPASTPATSMQRQPVAPSAGATPDTVVSTIKEVSKEEQEANMCLFNTFWFVATDLFVHKRLKAL